jgi:hypothetical protein
MSAPGEPQNEARGIMAQLPLVLVIISFFLMVVFQTYQDIRDHRNLTELRGSQESTVQEGVKVRQQLETLANRTAQLASDGDKGAREVVDFMQRQGIRLAPPK